MSVHQWFFCSAPFSPWPPVRIQVIPSPWLPSLPSVKRIRRPSHAEDRAEFFAEDQAEADDRHAEEGHRPDAEGAGDELAITEELEEFHDRLRDRIIRLLLR